MAVRVETQTKPNIPNPQTGQTAQNVTNYFGIASPLAAFGNGGEVYEKLYEHIQKVIKTINDNQRSNIKFSTHKLLKQIYGLNYSGIIIAERNEDTVTAHILVVERTGDYPEKLVENIAGNRYEILRTPADALDDKFVSQAQQLVANDLKVPIEKVVIVDGTLVPNEFDVTSEPQVHALIENTINAIHSELEIRTNAYSGLNIHNIINTYKNGKFLIDMYFNNDEVDYIDQSGMPIRQDICIAVSFRTGVSNVNSINQGNNKIDIVKTYGYIDFEWAPSNINGVPASQKFIPNFVITHIRSEMAPTPDLLILAIISVLAINEDMAWMQAFRPTAAKKGEIDLRDIGAINIEGNYLNDPTGFGKKYDTKTKTFSVVELVRLMQLLIRPNIMISIDLPKAGPQTWYTSILHYIKFRNSKEALNRIVAHLSSLTNGAFQLPNVPMFMDISNRIHGGYFKTKDGIKDIRHLSCYLSVANFIHDTNQPLKLIQQYTNTLYNINIPPEIRAAERKKFIDEMSNRTATVKMYYDRVIFTAPFLMEVLNKLRIAGFVPIFSSNIGAANEMFIQKSSVDFSHAMLGTDARILGAQNVYSTFVPYWYTRTF